MNRYAEEIYYTAGQVKLLLVVTQVLGLKKL